VNAALVRIDDRLLHGQVLVAWAAHLAPRRIVLASDEVARDPERAALYRSLAEGDYAIEVLEVAAAAAWLRQADPECGRTLVVVGSAADARRLVESGAPVDKLQVGGLHRAPDKERLLDYVFLSERDAEDLRALLDRGVEIEARDLPGTRGVRIGREALARPWP
jgi:mannose/fructose/N-acetylgalactosamine-specific phosphotransferase system component IIB